MILNSVTGKVNPSRIYNADEYPDPIEAPAKGNNKRKVYGEIKTRVFNITSILISPSTHTYTLSQSPSIFFAGVAVPGQVWRKPPQIGAEHAENVTIDPVICADGSLVDVQIIFAGKELHSGLVPNTEDTPVYVSVTESVSSSNNQSIAILIHSFICLSPCSQVFLRRGGKTRKRS